MHELLLKTKWKIIAPTGTIPTLEMRKHSVQIIAKVLILDRKKLNIIHILRQVLFRHTSW